MSGRLYTPSFTLALQIVTASLPGATVGSAYSTTLVASGGVPPYTWSTLANTPNTGSWSSLSSNGVLAGTPTTAEVETVVAQVTDSKGTKSSAYLSLSVTGTVSGPTPTGFSGSLIASSFVTVTGAGFGSQGPTIHLYDDYESNTPGQKISLNGPVIGAWTSYNGGNGYTASSVAAHTGSVSYNVNDVNQITNGTWTDQAVNIMNLSLGGPQTEWYHEFWLNFPGSQFVGGFGDAGGPGVAGTAPAPGNYAYDSCFKKAWYQPAKNDITGTWDKCMPTYIGQGLMDVSGETPALVPPGSFNASSVLSLTTWTRVAVWARGGASTPVGSMTTGFIEFLSVEKGLTQLSFGTAAANPLFAGASPADAQASYVNFPGYTKVANTSQLPLYDDLLSHVGAGSACALFIGDASTYVTCRHMTRALVSPGLIGTSWSDGAITGFIPRAGLDYSYPSGQRFVYIRDANGNINSTGLPI